MAVYMLLSYALFASATLASPQLVVPAPVGITKPLEAAEAPLGFVEACLDRHPEWKLDGQHRLRDSRQLSLSEAIGDIWGRFEDEPIESVRTRRRTCRRSSVLSSLHHIDTILDDVTKQLASAAAPLRRGAWVGPLALCRDSVLDARLEREESSDRAFLSIKMTPQGRLLFASITEKRVTRWIAVRIDGKVISTPMVSEPIVEGMIHINGTDNAHLERIRAATAKPC